MNKNEIIQIIIKEIEKSCNMEKGMLNEQTQLSSLGISSIDYIKLLVYVESEFDIEFDDEDLIFEDEAIIGDLADKVLELTK